LGKAHTKPWSVVADFDVAEIGFIPEMEGASYPLNMVITSCLKEAISASPRPTGNRVRKQTDSTVANMKQYQMMERWLPKSSRTNSYIF
jgi:hypothetical protein